MQLGHVVHLSSARWFNNYSENWDCFFTVWLCDWSFENTKCWETCSETTRNSDAESCTLYCESLQFKVTSNANDIYAGHISPSSWSDNKNISPFLLSSSKNSRKDHFLCMYKYAHTFCSFWILSTASHRIVLYCGSFCSAWGFLNKRRR